MSVDHRRGRRSPAALGLLFTLVMLGGCGGDAASPEPSRASSISVSFTGLQPLETSDGHYHAWLAGPDGAAVPLGAITDVRNASTFSLPRAATTGDEVWVTVERGAQPPLKPSAALLLRGAVSGGSADLSVVGAVTQTGLALRAHPGQFTMFTPSDNSMHGYPSSEDAGVWLFNMQPRQTEQGDMWVRLTQLTPGWTYEGWMVRDYGQSNAIWLSYGKFLPDYTGALNSRDDTGWGAFSGVPNFRTDGEEEFPGDDWISNPLGLPLPKELTLPLNLRELAPGGTPRWTHVITIEPASDRGEAIGSERPFVLRPYLDPFGQGGPGIPRTITFHAELVPSGRVQLR